MVLNEADQRAGGTLGEPTQPNPATALAALRHRAGDDRFLFGSPTRLVRIFCSQGPRRLIAAEPELAVQLGSRDPLLRRGHFEDRPEPQGERPLALVEDRPGDHRDLPATAGAPVPTRFDGRKQAVSPPQGAQQNPSGHFNRARYARHWSSSAKQARNSASLLGNSAKSIISLKHPICSLYVLTPLTRRWQADPITPDRRGDPSRGQLLRLSSVRFQTLLPSR